jgi:hypothetical protein
MSVYSIVPADNSIACRARCAAACSMTAPMPDRLQPK